MSRRQQAAKLFDNIGGVSLLDRYWGMQRLTVLAYHRIIEWQHPDFADYEPVVSATPTQFEEQMQFIKQHFNVISLQDLDNFVTKSTSLPSRPLLITFDDGYTDNYVHAYPILKKYGFPAVIFIVTSRMTDPTRLWWDRVAFAFHYTTFSKATIPLLGEHSFNSLSERRQVRQMLIDRLKILPENDKLATIGELERTLGVKPDNTPQFINWDQVRELVANGVACQPHTVTHPIMTRIRIDEVQRQLAEAKATIEHETNQEAIAFAYPNGTPADYSAETMRVLRENGYRLAFTLTAGPMRAREVQAHPLEIKRVYLSNRDTIEIYKMKVMGVPALLDRTPYMSSK